VPCLYSFDEVGAEYRPYVDRGPIQPPENPSLRDWHARLIALRRSLPALHAGEFIPLAIDARQQVYAFLRVSPGEPEQAVLVALNFGPAAARVELSVPEEFRAFRSGPVRDLLAGSRHAARRGVLALEIPGHAARIVVGAQTHPRAATASGMILGSAAALDASVGAKTAVLQTSTGKRHD
jgi:hypothetical protein